MTDEVRERDGGRESEKERDRERERDVSCVSTIGFVH
jgi:hypothetical protein